MSFNDDCIKDIDWMTSSYCESFAQGSGCVFLKECNLYQKLRNNEIKQNPDRYNEFLFNKKRKEYVI